MCVKGVSSHREGVLVVIQVTAAESLGSDSCRPFSIVQHAIAIRTWLDMGWSRNHIGRVSSSVWRVTEGTLAEPSELCRGP